MKQRRAARCLALEILYENDIADHSPMVVLSRRLGGDMSEDDVLRTMEPDTIAFTRQLLAGVEQYQTRIDTLIGRFAPEWPLDQIAAIDRNILRLACYEILVTSETPIKVAINEAVEMAKTYGADNSPRFVNGVLGTLTDQLDTLRAEFAVVDTAASA
jgi:N utilization substance protein B